MRKYSVKSAYAELLLQYATTQYTLNETRDLISRRDIKTNSRKRFYCITAVSRYKFARFV